MDMRGAGLMNRAKLRQATQEGQNVSTNVAGIEVGRIITQHAPLKADADKLELNNRLTQPKGKGKRLINYRLGERLGRSGHALEMRITDASSFRSIVDLLDKNERIFVTASKTLTNHLVHAQTSGNVQAGTAVFMDGECFYNDAPCRFVAVVKADSGEALREEIQPDGTTVLEYLAGLLFAEGTRLLKIGFFILNPNVLNPKEATPDDFTVFVFDHTLTVDGRQDAAKYFYSSFLGCTRTEEAPRKVRDVFEMASRTIKKSGLMSDLEKFDALNTLKYYFKSKTRRIVNPYGLADDLFDDDDKGVFLALCEKKDCLANYENDTSMIRSDLRTQKLRMAVNGSEITLAGSPETLKDKESFRIEKDKDDPRWLLIHVRGTLKP